MPICTSLNIFSPDSIPAPASSKAEEGLGLSTPRFPPPRQFFNEEDESSSDEDPGPLRVPAIPEPRPRQVLTTEAGAILVASNLTVPINVVMADEFQFSELQVPFGERCHTIPEVLPSTRALPFMGFNYRGVRKLWKFYRAIPEHLSPKTEYDLLYYAQQYVEKVLAEAAKEKLTDSDKIMARMNLCEYSKAVIRVEAR